MTNAVTMKTTAAAGSADQRKTSLRETSNPLSRTTAASGPAIAPAWSMALWKPNAQPRNRKSVTSAISASLGEVLMPFPTLSKNLSRSTAGHSVTSPIRGLAAEESV